jgi:pilus assembly protein CpaB
MNNKAFTFSIALAGFAVFMIYSYISTKEQEYKTKYGSEMAVVVANTDIGELAEIHGNQIEIVSKPKRYIEPGHTSSKEEVEGFIASVPLRKGEQITLNKLMAPGIRSGLSKQVTPGKRAISIPVNDVSGVNRLLKPGDRVDVLATIDPPGNTAKGAQVTKIILQDVPILAVGEYVTTQAPRKVERDDSGKSFVRNLNIDRTFTTITIEVQPYEAMQVTLLQGTSGGGLALMLRNNDDTDRLSLGGVSLNDVLGGDGRARAPAAAAPQR